MTGTGNAVWLDSRTGTNAQWGIYNPNGSLRFWSNTDKFIFDYNGHFSATGNVTAGGLLYAANGSGTCTIGPQNTSYCHFATDRAAFYFDHSVVINGSIGSYNQDFTLSRNGTSRITFYSWGTYVYQHLTIEDVFALSNYQASQPNTPASGIKVYVYNNGGNLQLRVRFSNGVDRALQLASS